MEIIAKSKFIRISQKKMKLVGRLVRRMPVDKALAVLANTQVKGAAILAKVLEQAKANAINNFSCREENLRIKTIEVGKGAFLKRWRPVSRGRAHPILKRTCHLRVIIEGDKEVGKKEEKAKKPIEERKKKNGK